MEAESRHRAWIRHKHGCSGLHALSLSRADEAWGIEIMVLGDGSPGGDEEGEGRLQTGEAGPLSPRPLSHHSEVLGRGYEQEAGLLRA